MHCLLPGHGAVGDTDRTGGGEISESTLEETPKAPHVALHGSTEARLHLAQSSKTFALFPFLLLPTFSVGTLKKLDGVQREKINHIFPPFSRFLRLVGCIMWGKGEALNCEILVTSGRIEKIII